MLDKGLHVPTFYLRLQDVETNRSTEWGWAPDCNGPDIGVGDREQLPMGTDWAMRYERDDIEAFRTPVLLLRLRLFAVLDLACG